MAYQFTGNAEHSLGVEVELQLVDRETGALVNRVEDIMPQVPPDLAPCFKREFMQSYLEINTDVCRTVQDVGDDLGRKLDWIEPHCAELGIGLLWSGTHPFSRWDEQQVSQGERYAWLMETMQYVARRLVCFGLHVHVGVDSGDKAIHMCDRLLRHLPTLLALSANSPFWCGTDTGLYSYRAKLMEALPTAGLPHTMRNWSEYCWLVDNLVSTGFIQSIREIWWDVRPHHRYGTVEIRIMDQPMSMSHLLGLVALTQSLVAGISADIDKGAYLYDCHPMIAKQNKWHAARYGMSAEFVDSDSLTAISAREAATGLIERCTPFAERLGCRDHLELVQDIIKGGTGAHRQRAVFERTGDTRDVGRYLLEQSSVRPERVKA